MVPVVDPGADDDRALALGLLGGGGPLAGELDDVGPVDAGVFFLPGRSVGAAFGVVIFRVISRQSPTDAELGHQQIKNGGHRNPTPGRFQITNRNAALDGFAIGEIVKGDLEDLIMAFEQ